MVHFGGRRVMIGGLTLVLITFLIFALIRNMPGTPLTVAISEMDPSRKLDPADLERISKTYGLDKPWPQAYAIWLGNTLRGDLGQSFSRKKPVTWIIGERIGPTLLLSVTSIVLAYLLATPLGLYATVRDGKLDERITSLGLYMLYSLPSFVGGLFLLLVFYQDLHWLPLRGMTSDDYDTFSTFAKTRDIASHAILPVTCYTYISLPHDSRFCRAHIS